MSLRIYQDDKHFEQLLFSKSHILGTKHKISEVIKTIRQKGANEPELLRCFHQRTDFFAKGSNSASIVFGKRVRDRLVWRLLAKYNLEPFGCHFLRKFETSKWTYTKL